MRITVEVINGDGDTVEVPGRWAICECCRGTGKSSRHVEQAGGGITASEMAEEEYDNPGFREDYFRGKLDRCCDECSGSGKVKEVDHEQLNKTEKAAVKSHFEYLHSQRVEERMREQGIQF